MHKKVVIIFWGNPLYDGRCLNMINQIVAQGVNLQILGVGDQKLCVDGKGYQIKMLNKKSLKNPITKYSKYFREVKKFINMNKPNFIIASDLYSMIPAAQTKLKNQRLIYDSRELYTKLGGLKNKPLIQKIWSFYEKKYIYDVDCTIVNAEPDRKFLLNLYGQIKTVLMKNMPGKHFLDNNDAINLKKELCIDYNQNILLYQGKFHNGRGVRFVIKMLPKIKSATLLLIGDGPMKNSYIETAKYYNVTERVVFLDAVPYNDLPKYTKSAFIGLSIIKPITESYENALPNKLFEYAVSGLPIICSKLKLMSSAVNDLGSGIAINHLKENEFINAYDKILNNRNEYILSPDQKSALLWNNNNNINEALYE
tara:strand:+ start:5788 stop:6891 length:1104 start_codon:yes stop_codon:yes gene_type:complete